LVLNLSLCLGLGYPSLDYITAALLIFINPLKHRFRPPVDKSENSISSQRI